jgi:threonine dehydrogenase-like Zn-dependent dehydrogenase
LSDEFDVIIDAVGAAVTRTDSLDRLRPGGLAIWLGLAEADVQLDGNAVVRQEKRVTGSFAYTDDEFAEAIRMSTLTDLGWTTSVDLEDSAPVFMDLARGRSDIVRAVIRP